MRGAGHGGPGSPVFNGNAGALAAAAAAFHSKSNIILLELTNTGCPRSNWHFQFFQTV